MSAVLEFERERLLEGMLEELAEKGHREADVASAMRRVGLRDSGWLTRFPDAESCQFAAYEQLIDRLMSRVAEACSVEHEWPRRVARGLMALLDELGSQPWVATVLTRDFPSIGPAACARYQDFVEGFAPLLAGGRAFAEEAELPAEVELLAVGAAEAIVLEEANAGRAAELPRLGPEILYSVLVPFLGPELAAREMQRAEGVGHGGLEVA